MKFNQLYKLVVESNDLENIKTGVPITIPAYRATQTKPGQSFKIARIGALGSGIYLSTSKKMAETYLTFDPSSGEDNRKSRRLASVIVTLNNPVVVAHRTHSPILEVLLQIGWDEQKILDRTDKDYEKYGGLGKWVQSALQKNNHDGIIVNQGDGMYEIVAYNSYNIHEDIN
jgi:hypothetical protein